jgi:branched-chain amino acid transport system ATP-binding protein
VTALLDVTGLTAGYGGVPVLDHVSLRVEAGTILAVLGANGAGKTTLLRALSGMLPQVGGRVVLDGEDLRAVPAQSLIRRGLAHVPEGGGVIGELTVTENLRLGGLWRGGPWRDPGTSREALAEVFAMFEPLARRRDYLGHQLSGGERQMLALGRALVARPRLLLLDEPSLGLAPSVVTTLMRLLRRLREERGLAVLLVEQNARSALSVADDAMVLSQGRVVLERPAAQLTADDHLRHVYLGF